MGGQAQLVDAVSTKSNTINTRIVPIVFVPGVMGTRLNIDDSGFDWDPDDLAEMADWAKTSFRNTLRLRLHHNTPATVLMDLTYRFSFLREQAVDPREDLGKSGRIGDIATLHLKPKPSRGRITHVTALLEKRGWGGLVWSFYGKILIRLMEELNPGVGSSERCPVYAFGYDWRQSNAVSGKKLVERIREVLKKHEGATQVVVVTHSMGGLVARAALKEGGEPLMGGVLHTVIPADGAVVAYRRMLTGAVPLFGDLPKELSDIMGPTKADYFITQSGLRGPTELLPHDSYPVPFVRMQANLTNKDFPDIFDAYAKEAPPGFTPKEEPPRRGLTLEQQCVPEMKARLKEASEFTRSIAGKFHPKTFLLLGDELVTDVEFDWTKGTVDPDLQKMVPMVIRRAAGDGTVPRASAEFQGSSPRKREPFKAPHAECFGVKDFADATVQRVHEILASM